MQTATHRCTSAWNRPMVRIVRILDEEETLEGRLGGPAADLRKCMGQTGIGGMERRAFLAL
eukprot:45762-Eustigmatos_ZCMA.PRE.1